METIDPEHRIFNTVTNAIGAVVRRELHDAAHSERTQGRIVESGGAGDVRNTYAQGARPWCNLRRARDWRHLFPASLKWSEETDDSFDFCSVVAQFSEVNSFRQGSTVWKRDVPMKSG
jgi:hypothetical protein